MATKPIRRVNFTNAIPGGMWIERKGGGRTWESFVTLSHQIGEDMMEKLLETAMSGVGMWHEVEDENDA